MIVPAFTTLFACAACDLKVVPYMISNQRPTFRAMRCNKRSNSLIFSVCPSSAIGTGLGFCFHRVTRIMFCPREGERRFTPTVSKNEMKRPNVFFQYGERRGSTWRYWREGAGKQITEAVRRPPSMAGHTAPSERKRPA